MWFELLNIVMALATIVIISTSFIFCLQRKYPLPVIIISFLLFTVMVLVIDRFTGHINKLPLPNGWTYIPLVIILFKEHVFQKLFLLCSSLFISLSMILFLSMLFGFFVPYGSSRIFIMMITAILAIIAVYIVLILRFGKLLMKKLFEGGSKSEWALYMITSIVAYTSLFVLRKIHVQNNLLHFGALLFLMWSYFILCFAILNTHEKSKQKQEKDFARNIISSSREHYKKMNEMYESLGIMRHDYKYHLKTIGELANSGDIEEIKKYLNELAEQTPDSQLTLYCSNSVLNALLSNYAENCAKLDISFDVRLALPKTLSIPNYEICIIIGNLLENAVEACQKIENERKIELVAKTQGAQLALMVKNSFNGEAIEKDGLPVSVKKDGGFGLRSVRAITDRYDGHILTEWDKDTFTVYVMVKY